MQSQKADRSGICMGTLTIAYASQWDRNAGERAHVRQQPHGEGVFFCNAEIVHNFQTAA
jgi:hypothetical protein